MRLVLLTAVTGVAMAQEPALTLDLGYRAMTGVRGHFDTYRSVVNLGEGPRLAGLDADVREWKNPLFDRFTVSARDWGGDPYNTLRLSMGRRDVYHLSGDYRNISYFNALPSFALDQRRFDIQRRMGSMDLELLPGNWLAPFLHYSRDQGTGGGRTPFVANGNEYPAVTALSDGTHHTRAGARIDIARMHITGELGRLSFADDQSVRGGPEAGNRTGALLGQVLRLDEVLQRWRVRGAGTHGTVSAAADATSWLRVNGRVTYSRPDAAAEYSDSGRGVFFLGGTRFSNVLQTSSYGESKLPRTSASAAVEVRPHARVRLVESWFTDRVNSTGLYRFDYSRQQAEALVDLVRGLTVRGGHRYLWGEGSAPSPLLDLGGLPPRGETRQHVGLAGLSYRSGGRVSANADYEGASGQASYFRASLRDYQMLRTRVRAEVAKSLTAMVTYSMLENSNPLPESKFDLSSRSAAASLHWMPGGGKRASVLAEYGRSSMRTTASYFAPQMLSAVASLWRERGNSATLLADLRASRCNLSLGGTAVTASGSRPTRYWQPLARVAAPVGKSARGYVEWRWFGLAQPLFALESFRSHQVLAGLRVQR